MQNNQLENILIKDPALSSTLKAEFYKQSLNLGSNVISYVDSIEQDINDLQIILGATIEHNTAL